MGDVVIRVEALSKRYQLGELRKYKAFRDTLTDAMYFPFRLLRNAFRSSSTGHKTAKTIWALKDVSFEIKQGEVVGVIGRNGAGKSTLLKILSRITEPTSGYAEIHGRVGSLLEVGTGFHPELTGRENIFLNGSIMGMRKREIERKFDEIVAFAEVEQFIDTQVKFYSSGMYMRLAFAVAGHLDPEILLVDEVLAVGDAEFQKKCLGKMGDVAKEGMTVFFVSHNMAALRSLCQRGFVLERGKLAFEGNIDECIDRYLSKLLNVHHGPSVVFPKPPNSSLCISSATVMCNGVPATTLYMGDSLTLSVDFVSQMPIRHPRLAFILTTHTGIPILNSSNRYQTSPQYVSPVSAGTIRCDLGIVPLAAGRYVISLYFGNQTEDTHVVEDALSIEVIEKDIWRQGQSFRANVSHLWWPTNFLFLTP